MYAYCILNIMLPSQIAYLLLRVPKCLIQFPDLKVLTNAMLKGLCHCFARCAMLTLPKTELEDADVSTAHSLFLHNLRTFAAVLANMALTVPV